jgi:hypothetical protein
MKKNQSKKKSYFLKQKEKLLLQSKDYSKKNAKPV